MLGVLNPVADESESAYGGGGRSDDAGDHGLSRSWEVKAMFLKI